MAGRHLSGTHGAKLVRTPTLELAEACVRVLDGHTGVVTVDGPAGRGKTFAVDAATESLNRRVYWLDLTGSTSPRAMYDDLWQAISGRKSSHRRTYDLEQDVMNTLPEQDCVLVIDEAQWANTRLLRSVRSIFDKTQNAQAHGVNFGLVLIGQRLSGAIRAKDPGLWSRASRRVTAHRIPKGRLLATLAQYHPLYANTAPKVIADVLAPAADGNWRAWAHILEGSLTSGLDPDKGITATDARHVLRLIGLDSKQDAA